MSIIMVLLISAAIITVTMVRPAYTANILAVFPHHSYSHHLVHLPYIQELANVGHNVTVISNYRSEHPNITDISIKGSMAIYNNKRNISHLDTTNLNDIHISIEIIRFFYNSGKSIEPILTLDNVNNLLNSPTNYDLLIAEHFNHELWMAFASKFNVSFILTSTCNMLPWNQHAVGQPYSLAIKPSPLTSLPPKMNFYNRLMNTVSNAVQLLGYTFLCRRRDEKIINRLYNTNVLLSQLVLNASLFLVNTHFTLIESGPLVPAVIEVGGIHIRPIKPLSIDIQQFIDEAKHGVIYFCMGSLLRGETFPIEKRQMFLNVFKTIPQRVLWKWEGEFPDKPSNVMIRKWMPQRDILAHPNVKLFISHGGLLGTTEAVYEGVPILSMPIFGDQMTNIKAVVDKGSAEMMYYHDLNENEISTKLKLMLTNPIYKQKAKELSEAFRDRPMSPLETAVYWTEYVIRHKGAPHLRSAAVGMPWYQYYLIDIIFVILISVIIMFGLLYCLIFKVLLRVLRLMTNTKTKDKQT